MFGAECLRTAIETEPCSSLFFILLECFVRQSRIEVIDLTAQPHAVEAKIQFQPTRVAELDPLHLRVRTVRWGFAY